MLVDSVHAIRLAEAAQLRAVCDLVDAYRTIPELPAPGGPRLRPSGADGTPEIDEFLVCEIHPLLGVSAASAWALIRDAINLRERHPRAWAMVQAGQVPVWQARQVAQACTNLPADAARAIDERFAGSLTSLPWGRAKKRLAGLVLAAEPEAARERQRAARRDRFVRLSHTGDGTSWLIAQLSTADAITLGHAIDGMARRLVEDPGYQGTLHNARADALGLLGRPSDQPHSGGLPRPSSTLVIHLNHSDLAAGQRPIATTKTSHRQASSCEAHDAVAPHCGGHMQPHQDAAIATVEGPLGADEIGAILLDQVPELLAHHRVRVLPVIDLNTDPAADSYAIPARIRQQVILRDGVSMFPFGTRAARACDLDHSDPWRPGGRGQTRPSNLGPLDRRAHRAKTHAGWTVQQASPGVFTWTSPLGYRYRVDSHGTHRETDGDNADGIQPPPLNRTTHAPAPV